MGNEGTARVGAQTHGDPFFQARLCAIDDSSEHHIAVLAAQLTAFRHVKRQFGVGKCGRERGDERRTPLLEQLQDLGRRFGTMLDGVHAVFQGNTHAFGAFHVCSNGKSQLMGLVARSFHQLGRHAQRARFAFFGGIHYAAGDHELD